MCRIAGVSSTPRPPSVDHGVVSLLWALFFGVFIYFGLLAIGASGAFSFVLALISAAAIWLFVRLRGEGDSG
jgi:hypothetical protein